MKTTTGEPLELLTTPVPAAGGSTTAGTRLGSAEVIEGPVEPDVLGLDAPAALAFIRSRRVAQDAAAAEELRGLCHWADLHRVTPGRELAEGAVDPVLLAQAPVEHEAQVAAAKARLLGQPVPDWATERLTSTPGELGAEGQLRVDGQGCFMVHEFAITHLATELGLTEAAARAQVGQSVELRDRLPRLYRQVMAGVLPAWKGRKIAQHTLPLSDEAAAYVDAHLAPFAHMLSIWRILKAVDTAITHHDPDRATALAEAAAEERGVWVDHGPHGPADLPVADSTSRIEATVDTPDALAFEDAITALAAALGDLGHQGSLDARRAKAVGVLADPQHALDLTAAAAENAAASGEPSTTMRPNVRQRRRLGGTTIHLHLHTAALGQLSPVARIDGLGPRPAAAVQQWLAGLAPGAQVTVTPVVDLAERISVDAHETPTACGPRSTTSTPVACSRGAAGRAGSTSTTSPNTQILRTVGRPARPTARTSRSSAGITTGSRPTPRGATDENPTRSLTWTSPLGKHYTIDHTGTQRIPDLPGPGPAPGTDQPD